jgi:hypothetical protein
MNCSDILKWGIFDTRSLSSEERFAGSLSTWLDFNKYASEQATKEAAAKAGIVIPEIDIPFEFDGSYSQGNTKYYSESLKYIVQNNEQWSREFSNQNRIANGKIVEAWRNCTELSGRAGLAVVPTYADLNSGNEVNINLKYFPIGAGVPMRIRVKNVKLSSHFKLRDYPVWPDHFIIDAVNECNFVIVTKNGFIVVEADVLEDTGQSFAAGPISKSIFLEKRVIEPETTFAGPNTAARLLMSGIESCEECTIPASEKDRRIALSVVAQGNTGSGSFFGSIQAFLYVNDKLIGQEAGYGSANINTTSSLRFASVPKGRTLRIRAQAANSNCDRTTGIQVYIGAED